MHWTVKNLSEKLHGCLPRPKISGGGSGSGIGSKILVSLAILVPLAGCGPSLSEEDLGELRPGLPKVPGADQPYQLPDLSATEEVEESAEQEDAETASQPEE